MMAWAMSHMILVSRSYCWVNDLNDLADSSGKFAICVAFGKIFTKKICQMLSQVNFQGQVSVYITGNFWSLPLEDYRFSDGHGMPESREVILPMDL